MPMTLAITDSLLIPDEDVAIGDFVINPRFPHHGFYSSDRIQTANVSITPKSNLRERETGSKAYDLRAILTKLIEASFKSRQSEKIHYDTALENTYKLLDSDGWFEAILSEPATRDYLQKNIIERGKDVYFVVGYRTIQDADVHHKQTALRNSTARVTIPLSQLATHGAAPPTLQQADLSTSASKIDQQVVQRSYTTTGEQIYAVEYRKVLFEFFSKKNIDKAFLQTGSRWEFALDSRGHEADDDDEDNIVEAKLTDASDLGNLIWQDKDGCECILQV